MHNSLPGAVGDGLSATPPVLVRRRCGPSLIMDPMSKSKLDTQPRPPGDWDLSLAERKYVAYLARAVLRHTSPDVVDDCLVEARIAVWRAITHVDDVKAVESPDRYRRTVIRRAVSRFLLRLLRSSPTVSSPLVCDWLEKLPADEVSHLADRADSLREHLDDERLLLALQQLPESDREILSLCYGQGQSDVEVASALGITPAAATKRRQRAVRRLRNLLGVSPPPGD